MLATILSVLGTFAATFGTQGCWVWFMDEPEMPNSLIK